MKKLLYTISAGAMLISGVSCKKMLNDNINPATPQVAPAHALLPPMFTHLQRSMVGDGRQIGRYVQYLGLSSSNDAWERHGYSRNSDVGGEIWRAAYFGLGLNINLMMEDAIKGEKWQFVGAGKALRAWSWQTATNYHGEIILKQAFEPNRYQFDYDSQEEVYKEVERLCLESIKDFERTDGKQGSAALFNSADLVYKGNSSQWIKFNYGLLARNANVLTNKASYNADQVIAYVDKALASNADNFMLVNDGTTPDNANYFGPSKIISSYPSLSNTTCQTDMMAKLLNGTTLNGVLDPRAPIMLSVSPDGQYRGVRPGQGDINRSSSLSTINQAEIPNVWGLKTGATVANTAGKYIFKDNSAVPAMTYAEMQFIKAEAAFRKGDLALAYAAFRNGITAHMDFCGVSAANRNTYLASAAVPQSAAALTLSDIMLQKYIALWVYGAYETWTDMRRFKYDVNVYKGYTLLPTTAYTTGTLFEDNNGKLAYRVRPRFNSEYVWNLEALKKIGGDLIDYHTKEPWFVLP